MVFIFKLFMKCTNVVVMRMLITSTKPELSERSPSQPWRASDEVIIALFIAVISYTVCFRSYVYVLAHIYRHRLICSYFTVTSVVNWAAESTNVCRSVMFE